MMKAKNILKNIPKISHKELVNIASKWLKNSVKCGLVLTEHVGGIRGIPDAIGWKQGGQLSIVVECKSSKSDFYQDKKKYWRQESMQDMDLGEYRYYMFPQGLFSSYKSF